jgi:glucosamine 6-phosphate synthetase-like amidotransferase/phosphosugar isomerase protein
MCAIFGAPDKSMLEVLYTANQDRGTFASSFIQLTYDDQFVFKKEGEINFDETKGSKQSKYCCGHVQAPTSAMREWSYETSHPFDTLSWMVFHNGVIVNDKDIRKKHLPYLENPVDTSLIVNLIQKFMEDDRASGTNPVRYIRRAMEELNGSFAVAIVDCDTNELYIARVGSILHYNNKGCYSTIPGKGYTELKEGEIRRLNKKTLRFNKVGEFKHESPFLFI